MKSTPILFNAEMVNAILDGRKTQTRRMVKTPEPWTLERQDENLVTYACSDGEYYDVVSKSPFGQVGDRIWVRETCKIARDHNFLPDQSRDVYYRADNVEDWNLPASYPEKWTPSIHMPRWASRITLEITDVRVERLQDITAEDAQSEGVQPIEEDHFGCYPLYNEGYTSITIDPRCSFATLWSSIYGEKSWDGNPWVWVVEFKRVENNK